MMKHLPGTKLPPPSRDLELQTSVRLQQGSCTNRCGYRWLRGRVCVCLNAVEPISLQGYAEPLRTPTSLPKGIVEDEGCSSMTLVNPPCFLCCTITRVLRPKFEPPLAVRCCKPFCLGCIVCNTTTSTRTRLDQRVNTVLRMDVLASSVFR